MSSHLIRKYADILEDGVFDGAIPAAKQAMANGIDAGKQEYNAQQMASDWNKVMDQTHELSTAIESFQEKYNLTNDKLFAQVQDQIFSVIDAEEYLVKNKGMTNLGGKEWHPEIRAGLKARGIE